LDSDVHETRKLGARLHVTVIERPQKKMITNPVTTKISPKTRLDFKNLVSIAYPYCLRMLLGANIVWLLARMEFGVVRMIIAPIHEEASIL
jgi:hypothetical protein